MARIQSGAPVRFTSGRMTYNQNDSGVVLHGITAGQLQDMMQIRKDTQLSNGVPQGVVYFLPQSLIDNTLAAFEVGGKTLANLDPNQPYIGPANTPGELGQRLFLYGPRQQKWDVSLVKKTYDRRAGQHRISRAGAERFQPDELPAVRARQQYSGQPGDRLRLRAGADQWRVPRSGEHQRSGGRILEFALRFNF